MDNMLVYLQELWQYVVIAGGTLVLFGAILNWNWLTSAEAERRAGLGYFIYSIFGQTGYRIFMGVLGAAIIGLGVWFLINY